MLRKFALLILALLFLGACTSAKRTAKKVLNSQGLDVANDIEMSDIKGHGTIMGIVTVRGTLSHDKGSMAQVGTMLIPGSEMFGEEGRFWKPEYEAMVGKLVEAKGEHYHYVCGPNEQCLTQGYIDYLRNLEYLKLVD